MKAVPELLFANKKKENCALYISVVYVATSGHIYRGKNDIEMDIDH